MLVHNGSTSRSPPFPQKKKKKKIVKNRIENSFLLFAILNVFIRDLNIRLVMTISWLQD